MYSIRTKYHALLAIVLIAACFVACRKEASLTPETVYDGSIQLPQGWSKYDTSIQNFHDSTGSYIAYKFDNEKDLRFFLRGGS